MQISAKTGRCVSKPGEGTFTYDNGECVCLEAKAQAGFVFAGWSGSYSSPDNPTYLCVSQDHSICASFLSLREVLYVDDHAGEDPGPQDPNVSDPQENGMAEHPFDSIQEAIEVAADGASVIVRPGVYRETIDFLGKSIQVIGTDPNDAANMPLPVIDGSDHGPVVMFANSEDPNCLLMGFVITQGTGWQGSAIVCSRSSPTVANCLIVGNRATSQNGAAVYCENSEPAFVNCTIANNANGDEGAGVFAKNSSVIVTNSIVWGNTPQQVRLDATSEAVIAYSNVAGGWPGAGNIDADPLFVRPGHWGDGQDPNIAVGPDRPNALWRDGEYHLQSQAGRWDPVAETWVQDDLTSPCIDAGDPAIPAGSEPIPNGATVNIGAYGGTVHAGKSRVDP